VILCLWGCEGGIASKQPNSNPVDGAEQATWKLAVFDPKGKLKVYTRGIGPDKLELSLVDAPPYVHALEMAPPRREPELNRGTWLVLAYLVVSVPDARCIITAVRAAEKLDGKVQLGLRPLADYDETMTWYGDYGSLESPLWLVMHDGIVLRAEKGVRSEEEIIKLVKSSLQQQ
jgi:hypothetical protein